MATTVLIVDDSSLLRQSMRDALEAADLDVRILEAENGAQAIEMLDNNRVGLVITDIVMPEVDGMTLLRRVRSTFDQDALPIILITSDSHPTRRDESFAEGANDFVARPVSNPELISRVRLQLRLRALQAELVRANERQRRFVTQDELTGIPNRKHLVSLARRELSRARRHQLAVTLCIAEIDRYDTIRSSVGNLVMDAVLTDLSEAIRGQLRTADVLGRMEEGRFGILLPHTDGTQGLQAGQRLCAGARERIFPNLEKGQVTLSVGTASFPDTQAESVEELVGAAESCLDRARQNGGDRVTSYENR